MVPSPEYPVPSCSREDGIIVAQVMWFGVQVAELLAQRQRGAISSLLLLLGTVWFCALWAKIFYIRKIFLQLRLAQCHPQTSRTPRQVFKATRAAAQREAAAREKSTRSAQSFALRVFLARVILPVWRVFYTRC